MNARTLVVLVSALSCGGAGGPRHYHINLLPGFSDAQAQAIFAAAQEWQDDSHGYVSFDGEPAATDVITIHPATIDQIVAEFGGGAFGYDKNDGGSSTIAILTVLDAQTFHQTALHELGHALGLVHLPPGNVMCANAVCATLQVTCGDLEQLEQKTVTDCWP
jgi:predicted Zn-dependent protease